MGVNWVCTMDVAIRAANWLIAYDLFFSSGAKFDAPFNRLFTRSIYEHGQHIVNNLEWSTTARTNHYLANIVGLIFISCYLSNTPETSIWLAFSIQEFIKAGNPPKESGYVPPAPPENTPIIDKRELAK